MRSRLINDFPVTVATFGRSILTPRIHAIWRSFWLFLVAARDSMKSIDSSDTMM
jgi:hypothetical protein